MKKNRITKLTAAGLGFVTLATAGMVNQVSKANAQKTKVTEPKIESVAHNAGVAAVPNREREIATLRVETSNGKAAPLFSQDGTKLAETVSVGNVYQISKAAEINHNVMFKILGHNQYIKASDTNIDGIQVINADKGVNLVDGEGHVQSQKVYTKSKFKIFEVKTIKGKVAYRLGTNKQWIMSPNAELFSIKDFAREQARANAIIAQEQAKIRQAQAQQAAINAQIQAQNNARVAAQQQVVRPAVQPVSRPVAQQVTRPVVTSTNTVVSNNTQVAVPSQAPAVSQPAAPQTSNTQTAAKPATGNNGSTIAPVTPSKPATGNNGSATAPVTPSKPATGNNGSATAPVTPSKPATGNNGSTVTTPVTPSKPATGNNGSTVTTPVTPSKPATGNNGSTIAPVTPSKPATGNNGSTVTTPVTPAKPATGNNGSATAPVTPAKPATGNNGSTIAPVTPSKPSTGNNGSATAPVTPSKPAKPSVPQGAYDYNTNIHIDNPQAYLKAVRASDDYDSPMFNVMTPELKEITKKGLEQNKALDPTKDNRKVDLMNITPAQQVELSEYAIAVVNSVRHQLGLSSWVYDSKVQGFANDIAKYYNEDNWSIADLNRSHDKHAITKAAREHGIKEYLDADYDYNTSEDEAGFHPYNAYANGSQDTSSTMGEIKSNIYWNLEQMFFGGIMTTDPQKATPIEFGHADDLIAEDEEFYGEPNKDGSILAAFSISYLPNKRTATTHYIHNRPGYDGRIQR